MELVQEEYGVVYIVQEENRVQREGRKIKIDSSLLAVDGLHTLQSLCIHNHQFGRPF